MSIATALQVPIENILVHVVDSCVVRKSRKILFLNSVNVDFALTVGSQEQAQKIIDYLKSSSNQNTFVSTMTPLLSNIQGVTVTSATIRAYQEPIQSSPPPQLQSPLRRKDPITPSIIVDSWSVFGPVCVAAVVYAILISTKQYKRVESRNRR
jgi:hypothetical protein